MSWSKAVEEAVRRLVASTGSPIFTRQGLIDAELDNIVAAVGSAGATPHQTVSRELQQLRDAGRIVEFGLVEEDELLPRVDELEPAMPLVQEERAPWLGPVDRDTMLVSRTVRDRQFRKRVLDVYGATCALTGMRLINGGGRAETQAAHIMSVEAGGPDVVNEDLAEPLTARGGEQIDVGIK